MTDAVGANPALASLVLATASNDPAAGAAMPATPAAASRGGDGGAQPAAFGALLQGLNTAASGAPAAAGLAPATTAAFAAGTAAVADPAAAALVDNHLASSDPSTLAALPRQAGKDLLGGRATGDDSPASGRDLPLAEDAGLLAALLPADASAANPAAGLAAPAALAAQATQATQAPATTATAATSLAASSVDATVAGLQPGSPASIAVTAAAADASASAVGATDTSIDDAPGSTSAANALALAKASDPALQPLDAGLPDGMRARLEAALADLVRSGPQLQDAGPGTGSPMAAPAIAGTGTSQGPAATGNPTDALSASLPNLRPTGDREAWAQGLGERLLMMADRGLQSATLRLQPEHLGPMEIRISVQDDGSAQVLFSAHHGQTRDALEGAIPRLRELFAEQGLSLTQANVDAGRGQAFSQRGFGGEGSAGNLHGTRDEASVPAEEPATWRVLRAPERRLDVMV